MYHKFLLLIIISPLILSLTVNETLYNILKQNAQYEIVDYNELFSNKPNPDIKLLNQSLEKKTSIINIINIAETIASYAIDLISLAVTINEHPFGKAPKKYDFRDKHVTYSLPFPQRECESGSAYAAALSTSYRRAQYNKEFRHLSGITIMEHYGKCKKINAIDAFNFIHELGLLEYPCRDQTYFEGCKYDDCVSYDERLGGFYTTKVSTYKCNEVYGIKGKKEIKREIYADGPVVTSFKFYSDFLYYKSGYYDFVDGEYLGTHEAVIVGWDKNGWIAQNSFGPNWGENGFFRVKFDNNIGFGEIAFASSGFIYFKMVLFAFLVVIIF